MGRCAIGQIDRISKKRCIDGGGVEDKIVGPEEDRGSWTVHCENRKWLQAQAAIASSK
jgi:hypothetical protein